jgi:glycerophosphoryl diester phosphodiesterase
MRAGLETDFFTPRLPRLFAHRGASGDFPENTLPAFLAARDTGVPYIELDVHMTSDGEIVVAHDDNLRRVSGNDGVIREMSLAEVRGVDAGHNFSLSGDRYPFRGAGVRVPTLREVFALCPGQTFIIEIKQVAPSILDATLAVVRAAGMSRRVLIASEHQTPLDEVRSCAPAIPTNFSADEVGRFVMSLPPGAAPYSPAGDALQIPPEHLGWKLATTAALAAAHRIGVEMHIWTVNEEAEMRELLTLGVDGIISNYPARLLAVAASVLSP